MHTSSQPALLWVRWLTLVSVAVVLFGLFLLIAPGLARQSFSLLSYNDAQRLSSFGAEAARYIGLAHAVVGAVMLGWGIALLMVVRLLYARGSRLGWQIVGASVLAWFVSDTAFSLHFGFWQNAVLNLVFLVLFLVPLLATYGLFRESRN